MRTHLNRSRLSLVLVVAFLLALVVAPASAQEMTPTVCDSTTILLLYLAEHDYGYQPMMDTSVFDHGQFTPLFDEMMAMAEGGMEATEEAMMEGTEEPMMEATEEMMAEGETTMEGMTTLLPATIADEDPACTELRASVEAFLYEQLTGMMMDGEG